MKKLKMYGFDAVKMAGNLTFEEIEELRQYLINNPNNKNKDEKSIHLYNKDTQKKLDRIGYAVYFKLKYSHEDVRTLS